MKGTKEERGKRRYLQCRWRRREGKSPGRAGEVREQTRDPQDSPCTGDNTEEVADTPTMFLLPSTPFSLYSFPKQLLLAIGSFIKNNKDILVTRASKLQGKKNEISNAIGNTLPIISWEDRFLE